jgi:MOSC domain-containing protein YiiM
MTNPCNRTSALAKETGFREAFAGRGGVRAEILSDGVISIGDRVEMGFGNRNELDPTTDTALLSPAHDTVRTLWDR